MRPAPIVRDAIKGYKADFAGARMGRMRKFVFAAAAALGLLGALPAFAQAPYLNADQYPFALWKGFAPGIIECGSLLGANLAVTTDLPVTISFPSSTYIMEKIVASNANVSLTSASGGVYTGASKTGTTLASNQALSTLTAAAVNTAGSAVGLTLAVGATTGLLNVRTVYLAMTTSQAGATADFRFYCRPAY